MILTMSGDVLGAVSVLSAAISPSRSFFVKKPEFSKEVVSDYKRCQICDMIGYNVTRHVDFFFSVGRFSGRFARFEE